MDGGADLQTLTLEVKVEVENLALILGYTQELVVVVH